VNRRNLILASLKAVSAVAAAFAAVPFVKSLLPSARAQALGNPIRVDLSALRPGEIKAYLYRGATMLVLRRTPEMLAKVATTDELVLDHSTDPETADPAYIDPKHRAINPEFLVLRGVCTHLGCVPERHDADGKRIVGDWWPGGFICPCHQSGFDYAGRVIRGPAPRNLPVPPHRFAGPTTLVIGEPTTPT
jgi:ubiquinol-cytochrome c reductase iron-sulfur subunit